MSREMLFIFGELKGDCGIRQESSARRACISEPECWSPFFAAAAMPVSRICLASAVRDSRARSWPDIRYAGGETGGGARGARQKVGGGVAWPPRIGSRGQ